jgi:hypothetical protein
MFGIILFDNILEKVKLSMQQAVEVYRHVMLRITHCLDNQLIDWRLGCKP